MENVPPQFKDELEEEVPVVEDTFEDRIDEDGMPSAE